jgi:hypothetical protein
VISTFMTLLHVMDDRPWVAATAGKFVRSFASCCPLQRKVGADH